MDHFSRLRKFQRGAGCSPQDALETGGGPEAWIHRTLSLPLSLSSSALPAGLSGFRTPWKKPVSPACSFPSYQPFAEPQPERRWRRRGTVLSKERRVWGGGFSMIKEQLRCSERLICSLCDRINRTGSWNLGCRHFLLHLKQLLWFLLPHCSDEIRSEWGERHRDAVVAQSDTPPHMWRREAKLGMLMFHQFCPNWNISTTTGQKQLFVM